MIFQNTNAVDTNGLLVALKNFLAANGWTIVTDGTGGGGLALEVQTGTGQKFNITSTLISPTWFGQGVINDRRLHVAFNKDIIGMAAGYSSQCFANDFTGPFPNIWFITDAAATYCHVIAQASADRYTHLSFGLIDPRGMHAIAVPFCAGLFWQYWPDSANFSNSNGEGNPFNYPTANWHQVGHLMERSDRTDNFAGIRIGLPDNLLEAAHGFGDGAVEVAQVHRLYNRAYTRTVANNYSARLLDYASTIRNHSFTGGVNLAPLPALIQGSPDIYLRAYVGDLPNVCYVNMMGLSPGQVLTFAGEEWIVFPVKQYGLADNAKFMNMPLNKANSAFFGLAYKKVGV